MRLDATASLLQGIMHSKYPTEMNGELWLGLCTFTVITSLHYYDLMQDNKIEAPARWDCRTERCRDACQKKCDNCKQNNLKYESRKESFDIFGLAAQRIKCSFDVIHSVYLDRPPRAEAARSDTLCLAHKHNNKGRKQKTGRLLAVIVRRNIHESCIKTLSSKHLEISAGCKQDSGEGHIAQLLLFKGTPYIVYKPGCTAAHNHRISGAANEEGKSVCNLELKCVWMEQKRSPGFLSDSTEELYDLLVHVIAG